MLSVIIPTYNESAVICSTIRELIGVLEQAKIDFEIIVSDDDSPDRTWNLVKREFPQENVRVLRRMKNRGLSPAVIDGFREARGNRLLCMDGDGQHDPKIVPQLYKALEKHDVVIGSRFVQGGGVGDWSFSRIIVSRVAAFMAFPLLRGNFVRDPMAGFFGLKKGVFEEVLPRIRVQGYKILLAILFAAERKLRIKEVAYTFRVRTQGESKLGVGVMVDYVKMLIRQFFSLTFIRFAIVGGIGTVVNLGLLYLLVDIGGLRKLVGSPIATELSIVNNFLFNNYWTFGKKKRKFSFWKRFFQFNLVSLLALGVTFGVFWLLISYAGMNKGLWYLVAQLIGIVIAFVINYVLNLKWVFKDR